MSEDYWDGGTLIYQVQITNGAGGGGDITVTLTPGAGNELELMYAEIINGDVDTRVAFVDIDDGGGNFMRVYSDSLNAGARRPFPNREASSDMFHPASRIIISGAMELILTVAAVAASQDASFFLGVRVRGAVPTVVEVGNSTPTITINVEQVF